MPTAAPVTAIPAAMPFSRSIIPRRPLRKEACSSRQDRKTRSQRLASSAVATAQQALVISVHHLYAHGASAGIVLLTHPTGISVATIDLNCDMGESFGAYTIGDDRNLMDIVTTANIACGFDAGDPSVMHDTILLAKARGVAIGAHPSFMDLYGFGRRRISGERPEDIEAQLIYRVSAVQGMASCARLADHPCQDAWVSRQYGSRRRQACEGLRQCPPGGRSRIRLHHTALFRNDEGGGGCRSPARSMPTAATPTTACSLPARWTAPSFTMLKRVSIRSCRCSATRGCPRSAERAFPSNLQPSASTAIRRAPQQPRAPFVSN